MKQNFWDKRIPSVLGIMLIVVGVGLTSSAVKYGTNLFSQAAPTEKPENIRITNISDTSFTLTYTTEANVIGTMYIKGNPDQLILDDRDQSTATTTQHQIHSMTARNLQPNTSYTFTINSGAVTFVNGNIPFQIATAPTIISQPTSQKSITGTMILPDSTTPYDTIVYATVPGGQTLSTLVKPTGTYTIPLTMMRSENLSSFIAITNATTAQLLIVNSTASSQVFMSLENSNPVPLITLSNNYDFTTSTNPLANTSALPVGFPNFSLNTSLHPQPKIESPKNNENFTDTQPLLNGQALPNASVNITIHSGNVITASVKADANGNWAFRPPNLQPGQHTITITTSNEFGILQTIQKSFNVLPLGVQVAEAATPSATLTPSLTPTQTPAPSPTIMLTNTPSPIPTQSMITPTPTATQLLLNPSPTPIMKTLPSTGSTAAITGAITGIITTAVGVGLFILTRGTSL